MLQQKQSIAILLLSVAAATVCSHPISSGGSIEAQIENNTNIILQRVEEIVEQRINQLLDKVYTLDIVAETLLNNSRQVKLNATHGTVGDLGNRCLNGFRSFPGVEKCYYLSNYKLDWIAAKEQCHAFGREVPVNLVAVDTTRKQYALRHLISSDKHMRDIQKWWIGGGSYDTQWFWFNRREKTHLIGGQWADRRKSHIAAFNQCIFLDRNLGYFWRNTTCTVRGGQDPTHHFICEHDPIVESEEEESIAQRLSIDESGESRILPLVDDEPAIYNPLTQREPQRDRIEVLLNVRDLFSTDNSTEELQP